MRAIIATNDARIIVKRPRMLSTQSVALYKTCKPKPRSLGATARSYRRQDGADADLSQICNRVTRGHGTPGTKTTDAYPFSFLYNNLRKIRRETTVGEKPGRR